MLTAFGSTDTPQTNGLSPQDAADQLAKVVLDNEWVTKEMFTFTASAVWVILLNDFSPYFLRLSLDGVEVDYLEYELMSAGLYFRGKED